MTMLRFPDLDTLRLALCSAIVPPGVAGSPARAAFDDGGAILVRPSVKLARSALAELKKLDVSDRKGEDIPLEGFACWPQLLPLEADRSPTVPTPASPVFFELPEGQVAGFVGEMLRLGVDRQSLRWVEGDGRPTALLRVVGPPYFSLLGAIDRRVGEDGPVAYVEAAPRVLVEFGHRHPLADRIVPAPGRVALIRGPRRWRFVEEAPFRDIYGSLSFSIPEAPAELRAVEVSARYRVPIRLARGSGSDPAELWVLRERAEEQVEALVGSADDQLLARLAFAVGERESGQGPPTVVIRARPSKQPPPALILEGVGFRPYLRLPNLFLPTGSRLHPPLRRDAVARLLAPDPDRVHWLAPGPDGGFVPESLPDPAFRPLDRWVDYVLDREQVALGAWVESSRFDFEPFACGEEPEDESPRPDRKRRRGRASTRPRTPVEPDETGAAVPMAQPGSKLPDLGPPKEIEPDAAVLRLGELEARYRGLDSPPEAADRRALLAEMAALNARLDRPGDASTCWALAIWEAVTPPEDLVRAWAEAVSEAEPGLSTGANGLDRLLDAPSPTATELRGLVASLLRLAFAAGAGPGGGLADRLDRVPPYLERHEGALPARLAWLAWLSISRLHRGDVLALARARDRLLERLHQGGLRPDLDLPGFLRFGAGVSADRVRLIREHMVRFRESALAWVDRGQMIAPNTRVLADLIFAFGLARLGDRDLANHAVRSARATTRDRDAVMLLLTRGFEHRVHQAFEGKPAVGPLPADLMERLDRMGKEGGEDDRKREKEQRYKVDRLRKSSRILEPLEQIDPYRYWKNAEDVTRELAEWPDVADRVELAARVARALDADRAGSDAAVVRSKILGGALEVAFRLGEGDAIRILALVLPTLAGLIDPVARANLLEKGLRVAAHFDRSADVRAFVARFDELLASGGPKGASALEPMLGQCFRGLRKLGLREEIEGLLGHLSGVVLRGNDLPAAGPRSGLPAIEWSKTLKLLLQVASAWYDVGEGERSRAILDEARGLLFEGDLARLDQASLACAYLRSMALAPAEVALPRMAEIFDRIDRVHDSYTTNSHYSISRLDVVEAAVSTLVSDDFALDRTSRALLEDDEFLVRRRVHRDVREALEAAP